MRKTIVFVLALCVFFSSLHIIAGPNGGPGLATHSGKDPLSTRAVLNVPGTYSTISAAITAAAASGDTILVAAGTYNEDIILPTGKSITLIGAGHANTTIQGTGAGNVVHIAGDYCTVRGFTIKNSGAGAQDAGIAINSHYNLIEDCNVSGNYQGIRISTGNWNKIANNTAESTFGIIGGIRLWIAHNNTISNNILVMNGGDGINAVFSNDNDINNNTILTNYRSGVYLYGCERNVVKDNNMNNNDGVAPVLTDLIGYWKMDEDQWTGAAGQVRDSSGFEHHGTALGGVSTVDNGYYRRAGDFDGSNDIVNTGYSFNEIATTDRFTFMAWFQQDGQSVENHIISRYDGSGGTDDDWILTTWVSKVYVFIRADGTMRSGTTNINDGKWHHAAATYDGAYIKIYVDGKLDASHNVGSLNLLPGTDTVEIGGTTGFPSRQMNGRIDDAMIYNRALSEYEIFQNYYTGYLSGITLYDSDSNRLEDNLLESNTGSGIVFNLSNGNAVKGNDIKNNNHTGIHFLSSSSNAISENIIKNNTYQAVVLDGASNSNNVKHNFMLENIVGYSQGYDNGTNNGWEGAVKGNYWSDWLTPDSDSNGIVDTPYDIDGVSLSDDDLPLCPRTIPPANQTPYEGVLYSDMCSIDNAYLPGTWTVVDKPSWLTFAPSGALSGTPSQSDVGIHWVNATISDAYWSGGINFTLTVGDINDPPVIDTANVETTDEDALYEVTYTATDVDIPLDTLSWAMSSNATFLSMNPATGLLSGTPVNDDIGLFFVNVSVSDGRGGIAWTNFTLTVVNTNDPPVWTDVPGNAIIDIADKYVFDVNATDIDIGDSLAYAITSMPSSTIAIDPDSGNITWDPETAGVYDINLSAADGAVSIYHEFNITVEEYIVVNNPPTSALLSPANDSMVDVLKPTFSWSVVDLDGDNVTSSVYLSEVLADIESMSLSSLTAVDLAATNLTLAAPLEAGKTYYWTVIPRDGEDAGTCKDGIWTFTVEEVVKHSPVIDPIEDTSTTEGELFSLQVNATDEDAGDTLTYEIISGPDGMDISDSGLITWQTAEGDAGAYDVEVKVTDGVLSASEMFKLTVAQKPAADDDVEPDDDTNTTDDDDDTNDEGMLSTTALIVIIALILLIVLVIVIILIVVIIKRKGKQQEAPDEEPETPVVEDTLESGDAIEAEVETDDVFRQKIAREEMSRDGGAVQDVPALGTADTPELDGPDDVMGLQRWVDPPPPKPVEEQVPEPRESPPGGMSPGQLALPPAKILVQDYDPLSTSDIVEILLITKEGLLLNHYARDESTQIDNDILSGMLTAVQAFVRDSFTTMDGTLKRLEMKDFTVLIEPGKHITAVGITKDRENRELADHLLRMMREIDTNMSDTFQEWNGEMDAIKGVEEYIQKLLAGGYEQ